MFCFGRLFSTAALACAAVLPIANRAAADPNFLTREEQAAGWKLLFDGKNVTGFRGLEKPDFLNAGWKIVDGTLMLPKTIDQSGKVTGGDLVTTAQYTDFEFSFEWRLTVSAASGVLYGARTGLGTKPYGCEFQLIDDVHHPDGLKGGPIRRTGALYGIIPPGDNKRINDTGWNSGAIVVQGNHAEHWVNGERVLQYDFGSPAFLQAVRASNLHLSPAFGVKTTGPIILRDKGEEVSFRSLRIRALEPSVVAGAAPGTGPNTGPGAAATPPLRVGPTPFKSRIPIPGQ